MSHACYMYYTGVMSYSDLALELVQELVSGEQELALGEQKLALGEQEVEDEL